MLLDIAAIVSGGLAVYTMGMLSFSFLSWFRISRTVIVLLYGLAAATITFGVIAVTIIFVIVLQDKATIVTPQSNVTYSADFSTPGKAVVLTEYFTRCNLANLFPFNIWWHYPTFTGHNSHRIGKAKFWVLVTTPLAFYSGFYLFSFQLLQLPSTLSSNYQLSLLVLTSSSIIAYILIGASFRSVAKALRHSPIIRDYMMISCWIHPFSHHYICNYIVAGYPPFGLANILLYGPSSFLVLTGLYRSAICVSEDAELRLLIKVLAKEESKLLDITASAE